MVDLVSQYQSIKHDVDREIQKVINTSAFIKGSIVAEFEKKFAEYNNVYHIISCGNGTDALQIALMALDLERGDEVILPVHTYVATAEVIALLGLTPVYVDVFDDTFTIDTTQIVDKISPKTKAIVPVHLYGQCADMAEILEISEAHGLFVIEDAAQAVGAEYTFPNGNTKKAGTMGHIGCTSFFPSKNLGCFGDGGAIYTNSEELAQKIKMIANHGQSKKYYHDVVGCNSRLDSIQAAVLKVKLSHLDHYNSQRLKVADAYDLALGNVDEIAIPKRTHNSTHVFHQYTIKLKGGIRDQVKLYLQSKGVPSMIYYPVPLHLQKAYYSDEFGVGSFPVTEKLSESVLSLPIHTEMDQEQQNYIIKVLLDSFK